MLSLGVVVFVLSFGAMVVITLRVRNALPKTNPLVLWIAQFAAVTGSSLWCLLYMRLSWDSTLARSPIGNYEMWVSKPTFGVILAFFAALVACLGTFLGLKDTGR
jgi:cytochrome b561